MAFLWLLAAYAANVLLGIFNAGPGDLLLAAGFMMFFYAPFTWAVVLFLLFAEIFSRSQGKVDPTIAYVIGALVGFAVLIAVLKYRQPLLFIDGERSMTSLLLILYPAIASAAVYLLKSILGRRQRAD